MKKFTTLFSIFFLAVSVIAQTPESFKYQAVIRDASGSIRANATIVIDIAILQSAATGSQIFLETHSVASNEFGLVNLEIGSKNTSGFLSIDWSAGPYFIKVSVDGTEMGTSQLLSVPYALYAKTAENGFSGDYNDLQNKPLITAIDDASTSTTSSWSSNKIDNELGNKANMADVYSKTNLQTSGQAVVHYDNINNKPENIDVDKTNDVTLYDNQTIGGVKAFNGTITVPSPVNSNDAVDKAYVDQLISRIEALESLVEIKDLDGNAYNVVRIGTQIWMVQNLKTTHFANGDSIATTYPLSADIRGQINPEYQWPSGGDENNVDPYGRLYTWYTVVDSRGLCPTGWHVPTDNDWSELANYLGGDYVAGGKLKENSIEHWQDPNAEATNESGFTALPTGDRGSEGNYVYFGIDNYLWSSTPDINIETNAWGRKLTYYTGDLQRYSYSRTYGFSVRCLKD